MKAAIITISDSGYQGKRKDESGPIICDMLKNYGYEIIETYILPDDRTSISEKLREIADKGDINLILTTGGTGFSERDCTPEATADIMEKDAPGIAEAIRMHSMQITKRAMLSRAKSVIRGKTLIINLPGSPKAVRQSLEYILPELQHGLEIMVGTASECSRK